MEMRHSVWPRVLAFVLLLLLTRSAYAQAPTVGAFSPVSGPVGTVVKIAGTNFANVTAVTIGDLNMAFSINKENPNYLTAVISSGAKTGTIRVVNAAGKGGSATVFTVTGGSGGNGGGGVPSSTGFINPPNFTLPAGAMTGHPRIFLTAGDVPRLQTWAVATNPIWNDLTSVANSAKSLMDTGKIATDDGSGEGNYSPYPTEMYAQLFAFMSLVDPNAANRADYASRAHALIMTALNQAVLGPAANKPFRTPHFSTFNRSRWFGECFPCTVDWVYSTFTAQEKATIRAVFMRWIQENIQASVTAGEHPQPLGVVNSPQLVATNGQVRWSANNYYCNHARQVGMLSMALDAADDVPTNVGDPAAGTLRAFVGNAIGAWLYVINHCEQTATQGGLAPEGMGYGESDLSAISMLLLAMHTTGVDVPNTFGAQAGMATGNFWDHEVLDAYLNSLSPRTVTQYKWIGPIYLPAEYGDTAMYQTIDMARVFGPMAAYDIATNNTARLNKLRWMQTNLSPGGPAFQHSRLISSINNYGTQLPLFYFLMFDPNAAAATDPRNTVSTDLFGSGLGRILSRADWTPNAAWFTYKLSWMNIDHQHADGNSFEYYRNGEWLTKVHTGYGFNISASEYDNTLALQNPSTTNNWFWLIQAARGSQFNYSPAGDPALVVSLPGAYTYAQGDATNLYNAPVIQATDITHASRSILWIKPDFIFVYDRAASKTAGRYKRFLLNTPTAPTINGNLATVTTAAGQQLFIHTLLPTNATLSVPPADPNLGSEPAQGDPMTSRLRVEDTSNPTSVRFLHVLQGANSGVTYARASLLQSASGNAYDGALVNNTAVLFARNIATPFTGVTYVVPSATTQHFVTGLVPGAKYAITKTAGGATIQIAITPGGASVADSGGVLNF